MIDLNNFQVNVAKFYIDKVPEHALVDIAMDLQTYNSTALNADRMRLIGEAVIHLARISARYNINMDYAVASTWWEITHANEKKDAT